MGCLNQEQSEGANLEAVDSLGNLDRAEGLAVDGWHAFLSSESKDELGEIEAHQICRTLLQIMMGRPPRATTCWRAFSLLVKLASLVTI